MKKIKVCFIATYAWALFAEELGYPQKTPFGGAEIQLFYLANGLARDNNYEVSFIVGDFGQHPSLSYRGIRLYKGFKPPERISQMMASSGVLSVLKIWRVLTKIQADVYIQWGATWVTGALAFFCRLFRKKFMYIIAHEIDVSGEYARRNGLRGNLFEWGLKNADLIITQNTEQSKLLEQRFHRTAVPFKTVYPIDEIKPLERNYILWVARSETWKRPELFIQLAQEFPQEQFIMVSSPAIHYRTFFQQIKTQAQGIPNLSFIEYVSFNQIDRYFQKAMVFVNTSDYEGFPNTFIQAAKNKTPILSFKVNPDDFINRYQCGLCANGDFSRLISQLKELLENKTLWNQMSANAFSYATENHDLRKALPAFKQLLNSLACLRPAGRISR